MNGLTKHEKHRVYRIINHIKLNAFQIQSYPEVLDEYLNRFSIKDNNKRDLALKLFDHLIHFNPPSRIVGICYFLTDPQTITQESFIHLFHFSVSSVTLRAVLKEIHQLLARWSQ